MKLIHLLVLSLLIVGSCDSAPSNAEKRMPKLGPSPRAVLGADLKIQVEIDGKPGVAIGVEQLEATPADFADEDRRMWKIDTLIKPEVPMYYAITGADDVTVELRASSQSHIRIPVLQISRRGGMVATLADPSEPFPDYHNHGGRLGRPGDPMPRITQVTKISARRVTNLVLAH